jgi:pyranose oxidase
VNDLIYICVLAALILHCQQIVLRRPIIKSAESDRFRERIQKHRESHPSDVLPIPFDDLEPQVLIPYKSATPWHVQIHRDAFSYGDIKDTVDPRLVVDLRFFGRSEIRSDSRVEFSQGSPGDPSDEWTGGYTDIYGMPQATV